MRHEREVVDAQDVDAEVRRDGDDGGGALERVLGQSERLGRHLLVRGREQHRVAERAQLRQAAERLEVRVRVLPEAEAGVDDDRVAPHAGGEGPPGELLEGRGDLLERDRVPAVPLLLRRDSEVGEHDPGAVCRDDPQELRVRQPRVVVHELARIPRRHQPFDGKPARAGLHRTRVITIAPACPAHMEKSKWPA